MTKHVFARLFTVTKHFDGHEDTCMSWVGPDCSIVPKSLTPETVPGVVVAAYFDELLADGWEIRPVTVGDAISSRDQLRDVVGPELVP